MLLALTLAFFATGLRATELTPGRGGPPVFLRLKAGTFDLAKLAQAEAGGLSGSRLGLFVVQFTEPSTTAGLALLKSRGIAVGSYLPDEAYLVRMTAEEAASLTKAEEVRAVVRFRPAWKLAVANKPGEARFHVETFPGALDEAKAEAVSLGATLIYAGHDGLLLKLDRAAAPALAQSEAVVYVEEALPLQLPTDPARTSGPPKGSDWR